MATDWAGLPHDLLAQIAKRVKVMEDFIAFRGVCTSWRTVSPKNNFDVLSPQVPLLMLSDKDDDYREFFSLSKGKVSHILYLPEARGRECFPFDQTGWLLTTSTDGEKVNLLNPFSRTQIQLPNQLALLSPEYSIKGKFFQFIRNAILSANPSCTSDYVLMIAYNIRYNCLAFWRTGDLNWTLFEAAEEIGPVANMIYFKGQFFLVTWSGEICVVDVPAPSGVHESHVEVQVIRLNDNIDLFRQPSTRYYLVELNNVLLLVVRFSIDRLVRGVDTIKCEVYELDAVKGKLKEINTLGDSTIFLHLNGAISIDSTKFTGVKPNHIYFTDDWFEENYFFERGAGKDTGAYNLEDRTIEYFYPGLSLSHICPPTWVIPSL